ncbi:DUF4231 domain-containing protein [Methylomicrobium sp. Wu6]|uniref:DUF4231 domain-containing protein n=1 Tax=Methylomicrobium sp. Wu6 TaxID=3107928 RepID=UPI002DD67F32|nr:DUF4231 domain-containing protein [Methylomicrobium sp. Wu6]MEC4748240.1 DUF4231 domain-containing protein [Methylomicrobium sp. Wu6]
MTNQSKEANSFAPWVQVIESRKEKAAYYFESVLEGQRNWYQSKAGLHKYRHLFFAIAVIVIGALISVIQVFADQFWVAGVTALLGAGVTVLRSVDTLLRSNETWQAYRKAEEGMKREYRLYINNAGDYTQAADEEIAYRLLVERVEMVIAEEQQLFWQYHSVAASEAVAQNANSSR